MTPTRAADRLVLVLFACCFMCARAAPAQAGSPEVFAGVAFHPGDPRVFVARYDNAFGGLFFTRDGARSLQIVPGFVLIKSGLRDGISLLITGDGKLLVGSDEGLFVDDGKGCGLGSPLPGFENLSIVELNAHPSDPGVAFFVTTRDTGGRHAGLWRRAADGKSTPLGASEPEPEKPYEFPFVATSFKVVARAKSKDGLRFFVAGNSYDYTQTPTAITPVLRVSDDLGASWTAHPIRAPSNWGSQPRILLVEASEPFKALVALTEVQGIKDGDPHYEPIFRTQDGGDSFVLYLDGLARISGALALPSGQILIADRGTQDDPSRGLWSAASLAETPAQIGPDPVHCLAYQPLQRKVYMCKGSELGYFEPSDQTFCALALVRELTAFVSCPEAPLEQHAKAIEQLCGGLCGTRHFASAPLCSTFVPPSVPLCGPAALTDDNGDPDPENRWLEPPGRNASPRCTSFPEALPDAGGANEDPDAGAAEDAGGPRKKPHGCQLAREPAPRASLAVLACIAAALAALATRRTKRPVSRSIAALRTFVRSAHDRSRRSSLRRSTERDKA